MKSLWSSYTGWGDNIPRWDDIPRVPRCCGMNTPRMPVSSCCERFVFEYAHVFLFFVAPPHGTLHAVPSFTGLEGHTKLATSRLPLSGVGGLL